MKAQYGFDDNIFKPFKEKSKEIDAPDKRGTFLVMNGVIFKLFIYYHMLDELVDAGVAFFYHSVIIDVPHNVHYFACHVARKAITFTECHVCIETLLSENDESENSKSLLALRD